jgi:aryl-alcohol dehydrogenase-like predicted oxidoreductase
MSDSATSATGDPRPAGQVPPAERVLFGTVTLPQASSPDALLDRFLTHGGRRLDLANVYGDGESSRIVGRWLAGTSGPRPSLYVKGCHPPLCAPRFIRQEVDTAREALGVDTLDYFSLHRDDPTLPAEAWADAFLEEVERGAIMAAGVSNWSIERFLELRAAFGRDEQRLAVFSNHLSLVEMVTPIVAGCLSVGPDEARRLTAEGVQVVAWAALAGGFLAGREREGWDSEPNRERRQRAAELAASRGLSSTAIGLAYVLGQDDLIMAAVGTRSPEHLDELMGAAAIELDAAEIDWLESGSRS